VAKKTIFRHKIASFLADDRGMDARQPAKHILVLENDSSVSAALVTVLEDARFKVSTAATAAGACAILKRRKIDLLVADIVLPDGTAFDVLSTANWRGVPHLLMTGSFEFATHLKANGKFYLSKPFDLEPFMREVRAQTAFGGRGKTKRRKKTRTGKARFATLTKGSRFKR
jgi:DNA-binding NtrC family response regulator